MRRGYARVSSDIEELEMQVAILEKYGVDKIYKEVSNTTNAYVLQDLIMNDLEAGDTLVLVSLYILSRDYDELVNYSNHFEENRINVVTLNK